MNYQDYCEAGCKSNSCISNENGHCTTHECILWLAFTNYCQGDDYKDQYDNTVPEIDNDCPKDRKYLVRP